MVPGADPVTLTRTGSIPIPPGEWVLLTYRLPREPSTPRSAVWRKLRKLGVAQIGDGMVALPAGPRSREQLEWVAEEVTDAGGTAGIWLARPATRTHEDHLVHAMIAARAAEYQELITTAHAAAGIAEPAVHASTLRKLRNGLRAIQRRDYFPPADRDLAEAAIQALAGPRAHIRSPGPGSWTPAAGRAGAVAAGSRRTQVESIR
jgi:hypothetical protein